MGIWMIFIHASSQKLGHRKVDETRNTYSLSPHQHRRKL
ncbi:hypothetical protein B4144_3536 [Bacillus atrophaeus]|nr:hypothetical protein B4144_3536 [Bacillus atrophaeus]